MIQILYKDCIEIVKDLAGNEPVYFDDPLEVKTGPHSVPVRLWALCVNANALYVMDNNEEWYQVELNDVNASLVIATIYQRLQFMRRRLAKAS